MTTQLEPPPIRVVIADDHPVYLSGLRMLLSCIDTVEVVGEARSGTETLAEVHRLRPHLALIDVNMPGASGIEVTKTLSSRCPESSVIMLSMLANRRQDPHLGPADVVVKPKLPEDLGFSNWERHSETFRNTYAEILDWIRNQRSENEANVLELSSHH